MKKFLILLFWLFFCTALFMQKVNAQTQLLFLNDGSKLKGTILEQNESDSLIQIQLKSGVKLSVPKRTIVKTKMDKRTFDLIADRTQIQQKGLYILPQVYLLTAERAKSWEDDSNNIRHAVGGTFTMGYHFSQYFAVGGGVGLDLFQHVLLPTFGEIRGQLTKSNPSLFYAIGGGFGFPVGEWVGGDNDDINVKGGWFYHPSLGLKFNIRNQVNFQFDLGYHFQYLDRDRNSWWGNEFKESVIYRSLALRAGLSF